MSIKNSTMKKYDSYLATLKNQRNRFIKLRGETKAFDQIKKPFLEATISSIDKSIEEIEFCKNNYIWDRLVIAFFGHTNAGKSTIIDTFRILFNEKERLELMKKEKSGSGVDGLIVGDGQHDFTKVYKEYEMDIDGMPFTLIDVPGIEGNEEDFKNQIKEALSKAHCVFYVQGENKAPDTASATKIKKYLNDWVKVYSVFNVKGGVNHYDELEERETLLSKNILINEKLIQECFKKQLGPVYGGNITVQALLAMCSKANFTPTRKDLIKNQAKLTGHFGTSDNMYAFSRFDESLKIVLEKAASFQNEIAEANRIKLRKLALDTRNEVKGIAASQDSAISEMQQKLLNFKNYVASATQYYKHRINVQSELVITRSFTTLKSSIYQLIENKEVSDEKIQSLIEIEVDSIATSISQVIQECIKSLEADISQKARELSELAKNGKYRTTFVELGITPNLDKAFDDLDINIKDIGSLAMDIGSWALIGFEFGSRLGPWGAVIGAAIGAIIHGTKSFFFSDHGKGKAKGKVQKELHKCQIEVIAELHEQLHPLLSKLESHGTVIQNEIRKEYDSLEELSLIVDSNILEFHEYINATN